MDKGPPPGLEWAKDVVCRNITIHGYCKYEGKGCAFKHNTNTNASFTANNNNATSSINGIDNTLNDLDIDERPVSGTPRSAGDTKKRFNAASASAFMPAGNSVLSKPSTNKFSALSPKLSEIQSFVPAAMQDGDGDPHTAKKFNPMDSAFFQPSGTPLGNRSPTMSNPYLPQQLPEPQTMPQQAPQQQINPYAPPPENMNPYSGISGQGAQDFMFQSHPQTAYPLQYHLYAPTPPPHLQIPLKGNQQSSETLFISNKIREALLHKNEATLKTLGPSSLPSIVGVYYDLVPLDTELEKTTKTYGYKSSIYKAFSNTNGCAYALRRIEDVTLPHDKSLSTVKKWINLKHSNVGQVVDAFTSRAFGDYSLIIVYDYYPNAKTLDQCHFGSSFSKPEPFTTQKLWTYMCQISAAISAIHSKKLSVRSLSPQKVIITSKDRIRLSDCGVMDIIDYQDIQSPEHTAELMRNDLTMFGQLILSLLSSKNSSSLELDAEFNSALKYLLDSNDETRTIFDFQKLICTHLYKEFDKEQMSADFYEGQLTRELENARLFRLMAKINFVIDHPSNELNPQWKTTGARYPIKLFHDYVFHQVDEKGSPVLDLSHVLRALNKLDAGIDEKILLVSPDEQSCLIMSYKEIKDLIEKSFRELSSGKNQ